jgi:large subunit ribosomal protein L3
MLNVIIGTKVKQTQEFTAEGKRIPVTYVDTTGCYVTQINDAVTKKSIQLGFGTIKHQSQAEQGHLKKAGLNEKQLRFLRTFKVNELEAVVLGQEVKAEVVFQIGDKIRVCGVSSGKGFASAIKRHHFQGGPRTHGQSDRERAPGSIGSTTTPGRVFKGQRMAGRMGSDRVTVRGLTVIGVNPESKILKIKGLIPGKSNATIVVSKEK